MILYICSFILFSTAVVLPLFGSTVNVDPIYLLSYIALIIAMITQGVVYANQCTAIEKIEESKENKRIYEEKEIVLMRECTVYLKDLYPDIEKSIFDSIVSAKALVLNFPEIHSHETIMKLVSMINGNKNLIYDTDLRVARLKREIRARKRIAHFWIYSPMIPESE